MKASMAIGLKQFALAAVGLAPLLASAGEANAKKESFYVANHSPLEPSRFIKLPTGSIKPKGWLRHQLELEANGMTGHLEEISKWCKFEDSAWASPDGQGKFGWEELPYWLKGYGDLGYVLNDERIIRQARKWIDAVLSSQEPDGYFGPRANKTGLDGKPDLWPHMVMLNVLQSFYEFTGDERVPPFMTKYCRWLNAQPGEAFGRGYWPRIRFGDNIETAYWLYNRTGETFLLDLARKIHDHMEKWTSGVHNWHNVNLAQGFREPAVYFLQARDGKFLRAAERNYETVMDLYGQFPGGGFAGDENCRPGYTDPRQGFETCGIVEFMHSFEMLTKISGNPVWSDRCEELAFNSLPAALTPDWKGLHYLTCANQVSLDRANHAPAIENGGTMFSYSPFEVYRCCQHNVSHGWPYYAEELWLATPDRGLCASLYAASEVTARVGDGSTVTLSEETDYPFSDTVTVRVSTTRPVKFPLHLRIPGWCAAPGAKVNGKNFSLKARPLSYAVIDREWKDRDVVTLRLPMGITVRPWKKNHNAVSVDYGPLTFSLKIGEQWTRYGGTEAWPEWEVRPATAWNYGLVLDDRNPAKSFQIVRPTPDPSKGGESGARVRGSAPLPGGVGGGFDQSGEGANSTGSLSVNPFTPEAVPITLRAKAKKIPAWKVDRFGLVGKLQDSPVRSDEPTETVTLIPMGASRLRISAFPVIGSGSKANEWTEPKPPPVSASHCFTNDTVEAMVDGIEPKNSHDQSIPRFTWWDHRGTKEWVQYDFTKPRKISDVEVYWFDDAPNGGCRAPQSWKLLYRQGESWKPAEQSSGFGTGLNAYNRAAFKPVETTGLRIEAQLQPNYSGGILEWKLIE